MSRIIVKNLPKKITSNRLQKIFEAKGSITDIQLKYNKGGIFRQFAFIGYKTEEEAIAAKDYFHNTFVNTSKIKVEICRPFCDNEKTKSLSKYSDKISENKEEGSLEIIESEKDKKRKRKSKEMQDKTEKSEMEGFPEELKNDAKFKEFLEVNKVRISKPVWCDDVSEFKNISGGEEQENVSSSSSSKKEKENSNDDENRSSKKHRKHKSDMECLNSKRKVDEPDDDDDETESIKVKKIRKKKKPKAVQEETMILPEKTSNNRFKVKLKNLPTSVRKQHIKAFFQPLELASIRIPWRNSDRAYVGFKDEKDRHKALNKNKGFLEGQQISVREYNRSKEPNALQTASTKNYQKEDDVELIAETGRLFVRNLCFSTTEEELKSLFSKYGPIAEIHITVDFFTKKSVGYGFVSFVLPEHAVKAYTELDQTDFQGRLLHLIPAKPKPETETNEEDTSFKGKKKAKLDSWSKSERNWNTLFLGINAVAEAIAKKRNIPKAVLLSNDTKDSLPVRMALAETELVMETKNFLLRHGVKLDALGQPAAERSKLVIIAKDLPAETKPEELNRLFTEFGVVSRIVFPPSAITALVVFQDESAARAAYKKLSYSEFHHLPLLLEWAPMDIFDPDLMKQAENETEAEEPILDGVDKMEETNEQVEEEEVEYEPEEETTLFVKNLNFETTEESLKRHFKECGPLHSVSISKKKDRESGRLLSMGFGFVQFRLRSSALTALQDMQFSELDGHSLQLKFSNRASGPSVAGAVKRKKAQIKEQKGTKILVRNVPFEATEREVRELFQEYGDIKTVRMPMKQDGLGGHRGFCFVDFITKASAKRAFDVLCTSTHLLGRRLVLDWANTDWDDVSEQRKKTARDFYSGHAKKVVKKSKLLEDVLCAPDDD